MLIRTCVVYLLEKGHLYNVLNSLVSHRCNYDLSQWLGGITLPVEAWKDKGQGLTWSTSLLQLKFRYSRRFRAGCNQRIAVKFGNYANKTMPKRVTLKQILVPISATTGKCGNLQLRSTWKWYWMYGQDEYLGRWRQTCEINIIQTRWRTAECNKWCKGKNFRNNVEVKKSDT